MKLNQFRGFQMLAVILFFTILLIYYRNLLSKFVNFYHRLNATDSTAISEQNIKYEVTTIKRIKRFLIFQGAGVVKLVLGTSFPIMMADKKRSLTNFYNFQMQYTPPLIPLYWWSVYNTTAFAARKRSIEKLMDFDKSRDLVYDLIKTALKRAGNSDNECLLNVICELARAPFLEDFFQKNDKTTRQSNKGIYENEIKDNSGREIYHKLLNAIFTPVHSNFEKRSYLNARMAGQNGANCAETFGKCLIVEKWFKLFTIFI